MKTLSLFLVFAALSLAAPSCLGATPHRITVPAHLEYCVSSKPLTPAAYELPEVRDALFQQLYKEIEQAALAAGLSSIGVPFIDAVTRETDLQGDQVDPTVSATAYIARECVIVPELGNPPLPASGVTHVPERTLTAALCASTSVEDCKRDIEKLVQDENGSATALPRVTWRTRPALRADESPDNLVASLSDATIRKLSDKVQSITVPNDVFVLAAEVTAPGN